MTDLMKLTAYIYFAKLIGLSTRLEVLNYIASYLSEELIADDGFIFIPIKSYYKLGIANQKDLLSVFMEIVNKEKSDSFIFGGLKREDFYKELTLLMADLK